MTKKQRFEVFKNDNFTCQYCGKKPPDAILEVDHIIPTSKGGSDDISNLLTSCFDCNRGKSNTRLENKKCRDDIKKLNAEIKEKELQLKEYYKFLRKIERDNKKYINEVSEYWSSIHNDQYSLNEKGLRSIKYFLKHLTVFDIKDAIEIADARLIQNIEQEFKYMCGILHNWIKNGR